MTPPPAEDLLTQALALPEADRIRLADDLLASASQPRQKTFASRALPALWLLNIAALLSTVAWIYFDPLARFAFSRFRDAPELSRPYHALVILVVVTAIFTILLITVGLFLGPPQHRRLRSWLALTAAVACWFGLVASWREIAWAGQCRRISRQLDLFEPVAAALNSHWPQLPSGELPGLGEYDAHGPDELFIGIPDAPSGRASIDYVACSEVGALRFELGGEEFGSWLEWHPAGSRPESFGYNTDVICKLERASLLRGNWHLARYRSY